MIPNSTEPESLYSFRHNDVNQLTTCTDSKSHFKSIFKSYEEYFNYWDKD